MSEAILGISAYYHDSAAALLIDGELLAAAQEERFTRRKYDPSFPRHAVKYVMEESGLNPADIGQVVFYDKPLLKFERLLETYHATAPRGIRSFLRAMPLWIGGKMFMRRMLHKELLAHGINAARLSFPEHHLSHAASAFYPSPFAEAAVLTIDGVGEWATTTISHGMGNKLTIRKQLDFPHSLGLFYAAFTYYCGFKVNSGEYKMMGLAPYATGMETRVEELANIIRSELIDIREDGSFLLNMRQFSFARSLRMCPDSSWEKLFGIKRRRPEQLITNDHIALAAAAQQVSEEVILKLSHTAMELTGCKNLCLAGGVALNCVANGKLAKPELCDNLWIQPASGDAGGAIGAALAAWHIGLDKPRQQTVGDRMKGTQLGPEFTSREIERTIRRYHARGNRFEDIDLLCHDVAELLDEGKVVGWFQGRMEFGPRALGNRSILADPRRAEMQCKLNEKIKKREGFRPFAPAVVAENADRYFDISSDSPYMLLVVPVTDKQRLDPDSDVKLGDLVARLNQSRSSIPAVTHVDWSARVQTVHRNMNPRFYRLLKAFEERTGCSVLLNTSFNQRGEPIVCTPRQAWRCFMCTDMDALVMGDYLLLKEHQLGPRGTRVKNEKFKADQRPSK